MTEKVIQFGTGMLLRALPDLLIHQANQKGIFNGLIVAVKSTSSDTSVFQKQNCRYTVIERGLGVPTNGSQTLVTSISRVLSAETQWNEILACARNPEISIVISNTTEAGLVHKPENLFNGIPSSFPGKLTLYLLERFKELGQKENAGMVILPTELIPENGRLLKEYVLRHALENNLPAAFSHWIDTKNHFCSTLVDRIVPGRFLPDNLIKNTESSYYDELHTAAEPYLLWAIDGNSSLKSKIEFVQADERIIMTENIAPYRERKLRILNGSNTHVAGVGFLAGCNTTFDTMADPLVSQYTSDLILHEIVPTIEQTVPDATRFAHETMDRFRNPEIRYPLLQIALQYSSKMNSRNTDTFFRYVELTGKLPVLSCLGLAAFFVFNTPNQKTASGFQGLRETEPYYYRDNHANEICGLLIGRSAPSEFSKAVTTILKNPAIFTRDLTTIPGLTELVTDQIMQIRAYGMNNVLQKILKP